jgi:hypothetical protein
MSLENALRKDNIHALRKEISVMRGKNAIAFFDNACAKDKRKWVYREEQMKVDV